MTLHRARSRHAAHPLARPFLFLEQTRTRDAISLGVVLIGMVLLAADFFIPRHGDTPLAEGSGFYVITGFVGLAVAVLACWPLRALLLHVPDNGDEADDG